MKSILPLMICAVLAAGCLGGMHNKGFADRRLYGHWSCVSATVDGRELPATTVSALRLELTKDRYVTTKGNEVLFDSRYRIEPESEPRKIFMIGTEGEATGKEASGIYKFQKEQLWICYAMPGDPEPVSFQSEAGSKAYFTIWSRQGK
jgi:uncharacterized protein (TIGR03067 family)